MKKILCGLVIAIMMTGIGYTKFEDKKIAEIDCDYLKYQTAEYAYLAKGAYFIKTKQRLENRHNENYEPSHITRTLEFDLIEIANNFANTYSTLCD